MKVLLITFSDNADHQDTAFGMFESFSRLERPDAEVWLMATRTPRVSLKETEKSHLVDCPKRPGLEKKTFNIKKLLSVVSWINKQQFDVIFFESLHIWNLPIMMMCHRRRRIFHMIHDIVPHAGDRQEKLVHLMNKAICAMADCIVLPNQKYLPIVTETYGVPPERVRSLELWRRFPEYSEPSFGGRVLFFGRMNPYKGMGNLLDIVTKCPDIRFNVVGRVDPAVEDLADQIRKKPNVTMQDGYVSNEEMEAAFINADWVVLPYNSATQSGVIIDAYRYSRPSIAFDVGAISEQVIDGVTGFLIEQGDLDAFVNKLNDAARMDREAYEKLSRAAYEYGLKKYSAYGAVDRFIKTITA